MVTDDYLERVYAGVLGKIVGVYLGRPIEGWRYEDIVRKHGEVVGYLNDEPVVTDDDISGTFTFLRALEDHGYDPDLTPAQIGQTWLDTIIEGKTILWWGGMGMSTEHTAFLRLKHGVEAPASGSIALNGKVVAEQIGAQIFIDGWGMVVPGDPARAADLARRAGSVSHDGEAVYAAQVVAAMVSAAFVETSVDALIDHALAQIPADCTIRRLIDDLRSWHATGEDWRASRARLEAEYGYDKYKGACHVVPNHGLVILALLHGGGDFDRSLTIVNTCGWDTDCNSGNVGCIVGILRGLEGISAKWRDPVADRLYLPTADGGRAITDAVRETYAVVNAGRALAGLEPLQPKACFDFSLPGSVQGWMPAVHEGSALRIAGLAATPTFVPPSARAAGGYDLLASPTLYPGQTVRATLREGEGRLFLSHYGPGDESIAVAGPAFTDGGAVWIIPDLHGYPIHEIGFEGEGLLESLDWGGVPAAAFPKVEGTMAARAWVKSVDWGDVPGLLIRNEGVGLVTQGTREWTDYRIRARVTPRMAASAGLAIRVRGLRRYYAFVFGAPGEVRLDKALYGTHSLATAAFDWEPYREVEVTLEAQGPNLRAFVDGQLVLSTEDDSFSRGAFGFLVDSGCLEAGTPEVEPL